MITIKNITIIDHPIIKHKLSRLRNVDTNAQNFRRLINEITMLMTYEITRHLPVISEPIRTPMGITTGYSIDKKMCFVPIIRCGLGMIEGILDLLPSSKLGHIGIQRDLITMEPIVYYAKLPEIADGSRVYLVDHLIATGDTVIKAIEYLHFNNVRDIGIISLITAPEGMRNILDRYQDVEIYVAAVDEGLDENNYVVPGIGNSASRMGWGA